MVTGASGFVGRAAVTEFEAAGHRVTGTSRSGDGGLVALELEDEDAIAEVLTKARPDSVVHLAGMQSVPEAWRDPDRAFRMNTGGTATLLRAIEDAAPQAHLVLASSAAVYGEPGAGGSAGNAAKPFEEDDAIRPASPYAASKAAAELLAGESAARTGLAVTVARLFNQLGPGQPDSQVPAGFAASIAEAEAAGEALVTLEVGNPGARRDFTDIRDTARALRLVAEQRVAGTFNFCSGRSVPLSRLIDGLAAASGIEVEVEHRPGRANRNDVDDVSGSPARLEEATGWKPGIALEESLAGLLEARRRATGQG